MAAAMGDWSGRTATCYPLQASSSVACVILSLSFVACVDLLRTKGEWPLWLHSVECLPLADASVGFPPPSTPDSSPSERASPPPLEFAVERREGGAEWTGSATVRVDDGDRTRHRHHPSTPRASDGACARAGRGGEVGGGQHSVRAGGRDPRVDGRRGSAVRACAHKLGGGRRGVHRPRHDGEVPPSRTYVAPVRDAPPGGDGRGAAIRIILRTRRRVVVVGGVRV